MTLISFGKDKQTMRKLLLSLMSAAVLLSSTAVATVSSYQDVPADHWAYASIQKATEAGIFQGVADGTFGMGQTMNRAQFVTALVRFFGWETVTASTSFSDVKEGEWYYDAVATAYEHDTLPAYTTTFRPYDGITREEMVSMLMRGLGYSVLGGELSEGEKPFSDVTSNAGFIAMAADFGIVEGYEDGTFRPKGLVTREVAATVLMRTYDKLHTDSIEVSSAKNPLTVATPEASVETVLPETPLEPLSGLYAALQAAKDSGTDMGNLVVAFSQGGVETKVKGSKILSSQEISKKEVEGYLSRSGVSKHYHTIYACAYLTYTSGDTETTVWYQTDESLQEKLALCRMFGVTHYILEE